MTYHTEKIETAIAKIHECLDAPIDPVRVRRLLKDIGKWSAEAEREAYARGRAAGLDLAARKVRSTLYPRNPVSDWTDVAYDYADASEQAENAIRALIPEN